MTFMKRHGLNPNAHDAVRKELLFSNVLVEDMKVGIRENARKRNKLEKQHMLSGRIIRSYRFSSKLGPALGVTRKLVRRYITRNNKAQAKAKPNHLRSKVTEFLFVKINVRFYQERKM